MEVTHFITVSKGVITGQHCGDINADFTKTQYKDHERVVIPSDKMVGVHDKPEFYDKQWRRKPIVRLITEKLIPMPEGFVIENKELRELSRKEKIHNGIYKPPVGYKIVDDEFVEMTQVERINAGIDELPKGFKIVKAKGKVDEIVQMTFKEQLEAKQITKEVYEEILTAQNKSELNRRLANLQTPEMLAEAELDEKYAVERRKKLADILAVRKQKGWPLTVDWPEFELMK